MFQSLFTRAVQDGIDRFVKSELPKMLDRELPGIIERHMVKRFSEDRDLELTEIGFEWAMMLALRKRWPDLDRKTAAKWMREYVAFSGMAFGDPDYEWTPRAADELAQHYVDEFGEAA